MCSFKLCVKLDFHALLIQKKIFFFLFSFTGHEKILRGLAVGISLTMFNRLEESDALVASLSKDKDPVLRRSGMYTIAMAYCGTGNNQAIRKLLHVAVSKHDVYKTFKLQTFSSLRLTLRIYFLKIED